MRYITIPNPTRIKHMQPRQLPNGKTEVVELNLGYGFKELLDEFVLTHPNWRDAWADSYTRLEELFNANPGDTVGVQDIDHECIAELLRSAQINGTAARRIMPLIHAVTKAPSRAPVPPVLTQASLPTALSGSAF